MSFLSLVRSPCVVWRNLLTLASWLTTQLSLAHLAALPNAVSLRRETIHVALLIARVSQRAYDLDSEGKGATCPVREGRGSGSGGREEKKPRDVLHLIKLEV